MNYGKIKLELERRGITLKEFCRKIDITEQGLYQMIRNQSMKVDVLERISEILDVPVSFWFDDNDEQQDKKRSARSLNEADARRIDKITAEMNKLLKSLGSK